MTVAAAGDDVAAGEDALLRGPQRLRIGGDVALAGGLQVGRGRLDQGVGLGAQGDDRHLDRQLELRARRSATGERRPEASGSPSSILMQRTASSEAVLVAEERDRVGQAQEA